MYRPVSYTHLDVYKRQMLRTKINVNLGVSRDCKDYDIEMEKVMAAVNMGAEAICLLYTSRCV